MSLFCLRIWTSTNFYATFVHNDVTVKTCFCTFSLPEFLPLIHNCQLSHPVLLIFMLILSWMAKLQHDGCAHTFPHPDTVFNIWTSELSVLVFTKRPTLGPPVTKQPNLPHPPRWSQASSSSRHPLWQLHLYPLHHHSAFFSGHQMLSLRCLPWDLHPSPGDHLQLLANEKCEMEICQWESPANISGAVQLHVKLGIVFFKNQRQLLGLAKCQRECLPSDGLSSTFLPFASVACAVAFSACACSSEMSPMTSNSCSSSSFSLEWKPNNWRKGVSLSLMPSIGFLADPKRIEVHSHMQYVNVQVVDLQEVITFEPCPVCNSKAAQELVHVVCIAQKEQ